MFSLLFVYVRTMGEVFLDGVYRSDVMVSHGEVVSQLDDADHMLRWSLVGN